MTTDTSTRCGSIGCTSRLRKKTPRGNNCKLFYNVVCCRAYIPIKHGWLIQFIQKWTHIALDKYEAYRLRRDE